MNKHYKCDFGYSKRHLKRTIIIAVILFGMSLGVYFLGLYITGSNKNLLTLVAVLGMLPAGKELVNLVMCIKAIKYACPDNIHQRILDIVGEEEYPYVRYDLYVTSYDASFPIYALTCFDNSIIGLSDFDKFEHSKFENHVNMLLAQNGLKVGNIKIFDNKSKFYERIESFSKSENGHKDNDYKVIKLMENLSL